MNNEDFIKKIYEVGKVIKLEDADIAEYALSDKEMIYYISEPVVKYPIYKIGDIVYVKKYTYKNGDEGTKHMFVIIGNDNRAVPISYFCMIISSNLKKLKHKNNILLEPDEKNNLEKKSLVKADYIYDINSDEISCYIGSVSKELVDKYIKIYLNSKEISSSNIKEEYNE